VYPEVFLETYFTVAYALKTKNQVDIYEEPNLHPFHTKKTCYSLVLLGVN